MIATTADRVPAHTAEAVNAQIARDIQTRIEYYSRHREEIPGRLEELDKEWDIERCLETGSATLTIAGLTLGALRNPKWLLLSAAVQGFFMQHALQGWCPPIPLLRRLGIRTSEEIAQERYALKALRGDFAEVDKDDPNLAGSIASRSVGLR